MPFAQEFPPARSSAQLEAVRRVMSRYRRVAAPSRRPSAQPSAPKTPAPISSPTGASDVMNTTAAP